MQALLASAAVLGIGGVGVAIEIAGARVVAWRTSRQYMARVQPPSAAADVEQAAVVFAAEAAARLHEAGLRVEARLDRHGAIHYRTVPQTAEHPAIVVRSSTSRQRIAATVTPAAAMVVSMRGPLGAPRCWVDMGRAQ